MMVQDTSEASKSIAMITLTTGPALRISESTECGSFGFKSTPSELRHQGLRQWPRLECVRCEAGCADGRADQQFTSILTAPDFLGKGHRRTAKRVERRRHQEFVVEFCGPMVADVRFDHDELQAFFPEQPRLVDAKRAQPLGAGALEKAQVSRIVDDTAGVGVLPVDAYRELEGSHSMPTRETAAGLRRPPRRAARARNAARPRVSQRGREPSGRGSLAGSGTARRRPRACRAPRRGSPPGRRCRPALPKYSPSPSAGRRDSARPNP